MATRTEMLEASDLIHYKITEVLYSWTKNEGNNLEGFINNPSEHVNYNPYMIMDFTKLTQRLSMLRDIENNLLVITEYKKGSENYTRTMYESAIDGVSVQLLQRLQEWLNKRYSDMLNLVNSNKVDDFSPVRDYVGMYKFNQAKFMEECNMFAQAIQGNQVIIDYKLELAQEVHIDPLLTTNEPPQL